MSCFSFQVEGELFPDLKAKKLSLRSVNVEEAVVTDFIEKGVEVFKENTTGPQRLVLKILFCFEIDFFQKICLMYILSVVVSTVRLSKI